MTEPRHDISEAEALKFLDRMHDQEVTIRWYVVSRCGRGLVWGQYLSEEEAARAAEKVNGMAVRARTATMFTPLSEDRR